MFHRRMTFGGNSTSGVGRSTSCPRPNRSASSPRRRLGAGSRDDDDDGGGGGGGDGDDDDDGGESAEDLRQTISNLRHSIMAHAESSAESGERLSSLRAAHDSLLAEHLRLQEQMDDAVELLKYLKEEKGGYEDRISDLSAEVESLRDAAEGDVVSMTISNLTREKMALESQLAEERRGGLARAAVAACAGMDDGGGRGGSTTSTSTFANREVVGRLERKNAELADEVESLRKAQSESTKRIEDMKRTNRVVEEAQKEKERARRMAKEEEDDDRAARYEGERIELLRRVEELGRELGSARAAREIEERESRRLRDAASASGGIEGERSACDRARRIAEAERDALLEERDGAASDRDGAIDNLRLANMQLESEREESDAMRRSIEAERDALLEEKEAMLARHRDEISATRARLEEVTKTTTTTTTNTRVGGEGGDSLSNGGDGDDATYEGGDDDDDDDDDGIDSQMDRMNEKFENLERINRELVREGRDMKLYVATMAETLTRKDEDHETAEMQFQIERGELRIQVSSLRSEVEDYRRRLSTMKEGATTRKKDEEDLIHGERREMQQQLASLHGRVESYQRQYASLQERVHEYQRREEEYQRRDEILREEIEGCERARSEAEDKVRELRDQLENHSSTSSLQYPDNLEKEMQDRLSKR